MVLPVVTAYPANRGWLRLLRVASKGKHRPRHPSCATWRPDIRVQTHRSRPAGSPAVPRATLPNNPRSTTTTMTGSSPPSRPPGSGGARWRGTATVHRRPQATHPVPPDRGARRPPRPTCRATLAAAVRDGRSSARARSPGHRRRTFLVVFLLRVHRPDVVVRARQVAGGVHAGQHRMVLVVVAVLAVAPDQLQVGDLPESTGERSPDCCW